MKVLVLNGSPKGEYSVTLQTVKYFKKICPTDEFVFENVGLKTVAYQRDIKPLTEKIADAEIVLFGYPVYTFLVPYQLHKCIELLKASGVKFEGKFCTQFSTSKHFYDTTAHAFIKENALDLGFSYISGMSADMEDLLSERGQKEARDFWAYVHSCVENGVFEVATPRPMPTIEPYTATIAPVAKTVDKTIALVTDCVAGSNLEQMIADFVAVAPFRVTVFNLNEINIRGGCLGCLSCASDGKCVYTDGFADYLRNNIETADGFVYAFTVKEHSMGSRFKLYNDRQFCNGHRSVTMGKPIGYLVEGSLSAERSLANMLEALPEVGHNYLTHVANPTDGTPVEIKLLARKMSYALEHNLNLPVNFYGVGGTLIFRDLIYKMRGLMQADYKFFKEKGFFNFPQNERGTMIKMSLVGKLLSLPPIKKQSRAMLRDGMLMPYKKITD